MHDSTRDFFDTLAKVLLRCWIFGFVLLLIWLGVVLIGGETIHRLHGPMFGLSDHELEVIWRSPISIATGRWRFLEENFAGSLKAEAGARTIVQRLLHPAHGVMGDVAKVGPLGKVLTD